MPKITRRFEEADLTAEWRKNNNWQVVFKIERDGKVLDYCRETRLRCLETIEEVEQWATQQCLIHKLDGAEIQLF